MTIQKSRILQSGALVALVVIIDVGSAYGQKDKYACSEAQPATLCNAGNTCGSSSNPCTIDIKRTDYGASSTPAFPNAKGNDTFCVKVGTTVTWKSTQKNTGFVIDFGPSSPFGANGDAIRGGADRPVSVVAKKAGCYKYSAGACISGEIQGMCGSGQAQAIVIPATPHH